MRAGKTDFHLEENEIAAFYRQWARDPDAVNTDQFDTIQLHLLECDACWNIAKRCEDSVAANVPVRAAAAPDVDDIDPLRRETERLCGHLDGACRAAEEGRLDTSELHRLYETSWREKALRIAQALIQYVPDDAPEIHGVKYTGSVREIDWPDTQALQSPLPAERAAAQLRKISGILTNLLRYLP